MKEVNLLIPITKNERFYLEKQGYKIHKDIIPTYTRYKHYFIVEDLGIVRCLNEYRKSNGIVSPKAM